jgi:hypothetical protein
MRLSNYWPGILLFLSGCGNNATNTPPPPELEEYDHSYYVYLPEEGDARATFRLGNKEHIDIDHELTKGFKVYFEDHILRHDDEGTGQYYVDLTEKDVIGVRRWRITYQGNPVLEFGIKAEPLKLSSKLPDTLTGKNDLKLAFDNLPDGSTVSFYFYAEDHSLFDFDYTVSEGSVTIPARDIRTIANGPTELWMHTSKETTVLYQNKTAGNSTVSAGLKRQFFVAHK